MHWLLAVKAICLKVIQGRKTPQLWLLSPQEILLSFLLDDLWQVKMAFFEPTFFYL